MIKKTTLTILLFFTIWFINCSCKKTPDTPPVAAPNVNNNVTSAGDPIGTFSGFFIEAGMQNGGIECAFYNTPIALHLSTTSPANPTGTVTAVYCNNVKFAYDPTGPVYTDTTNTITFPSAIWAITGNANFPSFTYTCTTAMPMFTNNLNLPSVINRNQNLIIPTSGGANYDQIIVQIYDGVGYSTSNLAASSSATSLVCVKDTLAKLHPSTNGDITITLYKYNPQTIGGKNYLFITSNIYTKPNIVIQ